MFYSVIETRDFSLFNQSAQALLKGYFINTNMMVIVIFLFFIIVIWYKNYVYVCLKIISKSNLLYSVVVSPWL